MRRHLKCVKSLMRFPANTAIFSWLLAAITGGVVFYFIAKPGTVQFIPIWDRANYEDILQKAVTVWNTKSLWGYIGFISYSFANDYSALFTIPLLPIRLLFGEHFSRIDFLMLLYTVYGTFFLGAFAYFAETIFPYKKAGIIAPWITVLTPQFYICLLNGMPDIGGAALILLAFRLYLSNPTRIKSTQLQNIAMLCALAILFRRHFSYGVVFFYIAMFIHQIVFIKENSVIGWFKHYAKLSLLPIGTLAILLIIAPLFVVSSLLNDHNSLYQSYQSTVSEQISTVCQLLGFAFCIISAYGLMFLKSDKRYLLIFFGSFFTAWVFIWLPFVRQLAIHHLFGQIFLLYLTGWLSLLVTLNRYIRTVLFLILFLSIVLTFTPLGNLVPSHYSFLTGGRYTPQARTDMPELNRMITELRLKQLQVPGLVLVIASSEVLSTPHIVKGEQHFFPNSNPFLPVLNAEYVDSRDPLPLNAFIEARYVLVANPPQTHLQVQKHISQMYALALDAIANNQLHLLGTYTLLEKGILQPEWVNRKLQPVIINLYSKNPGEEITPVQLAFFKNAENAPYWLISHENKPSAGYMKFWNGRSPLTIMPDGKEDILLFPFNYRAPTLSIQPSSACPPLTLTIESKILPLLPGSNLSLMPDKKKSYLNFPNWNKPHALNACTITFTPENRYH